MCDGEVGVQAVADPGAFALELVTVVDEKFQIRRVAVNSKGREAFLAYEDPADGKRVGGATPTSASNATTSFPTPTGPT